MPSRHVHGRSGRQIRRDRREDGLFRQRYRFASPATWAAHITLGGPTVDDVTHEVFDEARAPIPGLHAVGEARSTICGVSSIGDGVVVGQVLASA